MDIKHILTNIFLLFISSPVEENTDMLLWFNITDISHKLGLNCTVSQVELRMQIKDVSIAPDSEKRLELYQVTGNKSRYLESRFISSQMTGKWLSFDVTQTLKDWLQRNGEKQRCLLHVTLCDFVRKYLM